MPVAAKPKYPLLCKQGKTFSDVLYLKDEHGNPINLTGYTATIEIRSELPDEDSEAGDASVVATLTTENGGIEIDAEKGKISLFISDEDTAEFTAPSTNYWELELTSADGIVPYVMEPSKFKVTAEVNLL